MYKLILAGFLLFTSLVVAAAPPIESWTTTGGAKVMYVYAPDLPMLDIRMVFDAGSARDGDQPGLAKFANALLDQGAGPWTTDQIAERLEDRGINIGNGSLRDMAWVNIRTLTEKEILNVAIETLAAVVGKPRFATTEVERIRQLMQIGLRQAEQSPGKVAKRQFYKSLYGDHPYGSHPSGEPEALLSITRKDILDFYKTYYVARNAVIAIVGDVPRFRAGEIAEHLSQQLAGGKKAPALPEPNGTIAKTIQKDFPSSQTHLYLGQRGMSRHDPDYFPLYVGNHVLGGSGLVSILGEEVRNKRGLSYSVYSYFSPMRVSGPFVMTAQTKNNQAGEAMDVIRDTLNRFVTQGPSEKELKSSKENIMGGFPLKISSNKKIVEYIAMMGFYDYPLDWLETLVAKVDAVTVEQVRDAFKRRVNPDAMVAVVVGG